MHSHGRVVRGELAEGCVLLANLHQLNSWQVGWRCWKELVRSPCGVRREDRPGHGVCHHGLP
jgi:hypothetical protein